MGNLIIPIVLLIVIITCLIIFLVATKNKGTEDKDSSDKKGKSSSSSSSGKKSGGTGIKDDSVKKEDIFNFMEFDKIQNDMIVQNKGTKYTMVIKCKGINYDLMSEVEQLAVEEGFITFLNTLRYPIQLYVQAQNIDLKKSINIYNQNVRALQQEYNDATTEYNSVVNSLESTRSDIARAEYNKKSVQNVLEYASDIVKYVERMSLNKNLLQRSFYVIVSYYSAEITASASFTKEEIADICYNELYTRVASIISALASCSVSGTPLDSNGLAELLYNSYNRDDRNYINIKQALESGYYRLYSTSKDAFEKKTELLEKQIENEAQIKAYEALKKAIEDGDYVSKEAQQDEINQEISKSAIDIIKTENVDQKIKETAQQIIVDDYKKEKKELFEKAKASAVNAVKPETKVEEKETVTKNSEINNTAVNVVENVNNFNNTNNVNATATISQETFASQLKNDAEIVPEVKKEEQPIVEKEPVMPEQQLPEEPIIPDVVEKKEENNSQNTNENVNNTTEDNNSNISNNDDNNNDDFEDDFFDSII